MHVMNSIKQKTAPLLGIGVQLKQTYYEKTKLKLL